MPYAVYGFISVILWIVGRCVYNVYLHPLRNIPGPFLAKMSRWWLFNLEMRRNAHMGILHLHRQYGPVIRISPDEVSFNDIEASEAIYGQTSAFTKSDYFYRAFEDQASNLFTMRDRQQHSQDKRLMSHAFSRANIVMHEPSIHEKALYLMGRIEQRTKEHRTIPLYPALRCMALDTISDFAFGKSTNALRLDDFESGILDSIDKATGSVPFFQHFPILRELLRRASCYNISSVPNGFLDLGHTANAGLQEMNQNGQWTMFKNMIASATKKLTSLSEDHLVAEGIVMIVAGTDTTAVSLSVALHNLIQQPGCYQMLHNEVRTVMPTLDSKPTVQDLDSLPFLDACIKEGLRVSCPSRTRMPRTVPKEGWALKGHYFPPGIKVSLSPLYFLYDEDIFPSPATYDPTRWLVDDGKKRRMMSYFHPFSRGTRQCIGQNLSLIEQKIVLSLFVRRFKPRCVLKKAILIQEAITASISEPMEVCVDLAAE